MSPIDALAPQPLSPTEILDLVTRVRALDARVRAVRAMHLKTLRQAQVLKAQSKKTKHQ